MKKEVGVVGLGRMGSNMTLNLLDKKWKVVVYNRSSGPARVLVKKGAKTGKNYDEFVSKLGKKKVILIMVSAKAVDLVIKDLLPFLRKGDIIIDGGNSYYEDSIKRYKQLKSKGINFLDMGTSGGLEGARKGASLMIGGDKKTFRAVEPLFKSLAVEKGYGYMGESGAGHFVKIIHNGVEYAMLEAYGEGYEILEKSKYKFDYSEVSRIWHHGSVIRSWLMELAEKAFKKNPKLKGVPGIIGGGTTGTWAYKIAKKEKADAHAMEHAIMERKKSKKRQSFASKFIAEMRNQFGGHKIERG